jgi:hypothetical protein
MARSACFAILLLLVAVSVSSAQSHALPPAVGGITFDQVIRLARSGLPDTVIIAQIKQRSQPFALTPDDMLQLKNAQVSNQVIEAMAGPALLVVRAADANSLSNHTTARPSIPGEPGMYIAKGPDNTKIIGQVLTFNRTGSLLVHNVTFGIKARHENVQLLGPHAQVVVGGLPVFYFIPVKQEADAGLDAGDLVLIKLEEKPERRQFEIDAKGAWRASEGISITHQVGLIRSEAAPGVYKVMPLSALARGEYAIYLRRGEGLKAYVYDFSSNGER